MGQGIPISFHSNLNGCIASRALAMTYSGVALALSTLSPSVELSSTYSLVIPRSLGIQRIDPAVCERTATLLHRSGKSVSMTPIHIS